MNSKLALLHPYPFTKLATLLADSTPSADYTPIKLGIGEPKHMPPAVVLDVIKDNLDKLQHYPSTAGMIELRQAIAEWLSKRFHLTQIDANGQIIPVTGTREALFSFAQAVVDTDKTAVNKAATDDTANNAPIVVMPNPFYQIYEGAALLAGAQPYFVNCTANNEFKGDYKQVPDAIWQQTQLVFVCSPNNPTGAVMNEVDWLSLIELSDKFDFVIASDECYSELYADKPPVGLLEVCARIGRHDYKNCVVFHSLSKRSNLPGLRSGFIAGDAALLAPYLLYRTYHGSAMPITHQLASIAAWQDETHVQDNRDLYQKKFDLWMNELGEALDLRRPEASFYLWVAVPNLPPFIDAAGLPDDEAFVKSLYEQVNIHALAGRYLSREVAGINPGRGFVRLALVASVEENIDAIARIKTLLSQANSH